MGEAKDLVGGCLHMEPMAGYMEACALLQKEYGNAYTVSSAYVDKVLTWPSIRHDDSTALRKLGLFLVRCNKAMRNITNMDVLNHLPNLQTIVTKLPGYLQNKWRDHASRLRRNEQRVANFNDLTCFVESASESANDSVFGKFALNKCTQSGLPSGRGPSKGAHDNKAKSSITQGVQLNHKRPPNLCLTKDCATIATNLMTLTIVLISTNCPSMITDLI